MPEDHLLAARTVVVEKKGQPEVRGQNHPDIAVLLHCIPHGLVLVLEQACRFLEETVRRLLVKIEPVFGKVVDDAFDRHGVEIAQLGDARDERAVETGVLQRSERGLRADQAAFRLYGVDITSLMNCGGIMM